jgi:hypothetical protein
MKETVKPLGERVQQIVDGACAEEDLFREVRNLIGVAWPEYELCKRRMPQDECEESKGEAEFSEKVRVLARQF